MPLIKNAKPGTKGFRQNIETEIKMGHKKPKQAVAIAYDEARKTKPKAKKHDDVREDKALIRKTIKGSCMKKGK